MTIDDEHETDSHTIEYRQADSELGGDDLDEESDEESPSSLTADDVDDVLLYTLDWSVQSLLERIGGTFDINPAFQRRDAWNADRKSKYIESLMLGLPVPQVVLAEDKTRKGSFIVLDGKQRLVTMKQFGDPNDSFRTFKLKNLQFLSSLNGMSLQEIQNESPESRSYVDNFLAQPVRTIVVRNWGKPAVLYQIFVRLNQGSLPLSPQELRQALFPGSFSSWINNRSARSAAIHRARRTKGEDFRMRDAEMLLRSVALQQNLESYDGDLRQFLDTMCETGNKDWESNRERYESLADRTELAIERTEKIFKLTNSFLRYDGEKEQYVRRFNIAVFDTMCIVLSSEELTDSLVSQFSQEIRMAFEQLCSDSREFENALKSTTKTARATATRIKLFAEAVERCTGATLDASARANALLDRVTSTSKNKAS
ncbi:GmrSD restriction endonuclease domain-containing protein [Rhodococcus sp. IEGM1428]|uniref:GmrSD restriction endonuclease domain-containing protein n=1 Tax=Rhodococcus sp. IEGM1428 TaxID=3392191 RepID=UPI003D14F102